MYLYVKFIVFELLLIQQEHQHFFVPIR